MLDIQDNMVQKKKYAEQRRARLGDYVKVIRRRSPLVERRSWDVNFKNHNSGIILNIYITLDLENNLFSKKELFISRDA